MTATNSEPKIRIKARCLFLHEGRALVMNANSLKGINTEGKTIIPGNFYCVLGGGMNPLETSEQGIRREIREELGTEIENLEFITVIENIFTYAGERGHEIVFLYKGDLQDKTLYDLKSTHIDEGRYSMDAEWVPFETLLSEESPLYPAFDYSQIFNK